MHLVVSYVLFKYLQLPFDVWRPLSQIPHLNTRIYIAYSQTKLKRKNYYSILRMICVAEIRNIGAQNKKK